MRAQQPAQPPSGEVRGEVREDESEVPRGGEYSPILGMEENGSEDGEIAAPCGKGASSSKKRKRKAAPHNQNLDELVSHNPCLEKLSSCSNDREY